VRADGETGRSWMRVRAYDPSVGRGISRDPLGRAPLFFADQPYADAGNNPLVNVDPSGQRPRMLDGGDGVTAAPATHTAHWGQHARILTVPGRPQKAGNGCSKVCIERGQKWLDAIAAFVSLMRGASLWDDIRDMIKEVPLGISALAMAIGGDLMALIPFVDALTHVARDFIDIIAALNNIFLPVGGLPGLSQFTRQIRGLSALLDLVTPIISIIGTLVGAWFNPLGAVTSRLSDYWSPYIARVFAGFAKGAVPWLFKEVGGEALGWAFNAIANGTEASVTPQQFCDVALQLCR
jgi:RHS repeat-associated protein